MKQLSFAQKRIRRRIAKASKRGRYLIVSRRGRRDRPGRKKGSAKRKLLEETQSKGYSLPSALKTLKMHIPKMSKK
jgi:DNA invertase Pin-like site-specific DNA recombinase